MESLNIGDIAPDFSAREHRGGTFRLSDLRGKKVILYFYPRDNTPGCTAEACDLQENHDLWLNRGYEIIGVSPDSEQSHQKFSEKYGLAFRLVPDTEKEVLKLYGAYGPKAMYGKMLDGVIRTTFLIDESGYITHIFKKVNTRDHSNQILSAIEEAT